MSLSVPAQLLLSPSLLHSFVDSFFSGKKAEVKERLRASMDSIVNDLFEQMVCQVKEMLLPPKEKEEIMVKTPVPQTPAQTGGKKLPSNFSPSSRKKQPPTQVKKLVYAHKSTYPVKLASKTSNSTTSLMLKVKGQQAGPSKRNTSIFENLDSSSMDFLNSPNDNESSSTSKKMKMTVQFEDTSVLDEDLVNLRKEVVEDDDNDLANGGGGDDIMYEIAENESKNVCDGKNSVNEVSKNAYHLSDVEFRSL